MLKQEFKIAMHNKLGLGPYYDPASVSRRATEWLIVERKGRILLISDASQPAGAADADPATPAPDTIRPGNTLVGVLIENDTSHQADVFLLVRNLPNGIVTPGNFFPGEGYARLSESAGLITLSAHGRHYHSAEDRGCMTIFVDGGVPSSQDPSAINWHFDASQRDWIGQSI